MGSCRLRSLGAVLDPEMEKFRAVKITAFNSSTACCLVHSCLQMIGRMSMKEFLSL